MFNKFKKWFKKVNQDTCIHKFNMDEVTDTKIPDDKVLCTKCKRSLKVTQELLDY